MVKQCYLCGKFIDETKHHIIKKKYEGYNQPIKILCEECHNKVHNTLTNAIVDISLLEKKQEVNIGNAQLILSLGSVFINQEPQKIVDSNIVLGCNLYNTTTKSEEHFEATLHGGSVITFAGSPSGVVYYSVLYEQKLPNVSGTVIP